MTHRLFDREQLSSLVLEHGPSSQECAKAFVILEQLTRRRIDGTLASLCETRIEQSFNERLFSELFGYRTLLNNGAGSYNLHPGAYHLQAKNYYPTLGQNRRYYDDFSLGFFGPTLDERKVLAELKDLGTNLDAPQKSGSYGGMTTIEQAFRTAATNPTIDWVMVSNFDEIRLYRSNNPGKYEKVVLSEIISYSEFQYAYVLFSRRTLLGEQGKKSPLLKLSDGDKKMLLPARKGEQIRLIQEIAIPDPHGRMMPLHMMDEYLTAALTNIRSQYIWSSPDLEDDQLVSAYRDEQRGVEGRVEYSRANILRLSQYVRPKQVITPKGKTPLIEAIWIAYNIALFINLAINVISKHTSMYSARYQAHLCEVEGAVLECSNWAGVDNILDLQMGIDSTHVSLQDYEFHEKAVVQTVTEIIRELLFPFVRKSPDPYSHPGRPSIIVSRIRPPEKEIARVLAIFSTT